MGLGDATKPITWKKYKMSIDEQIKQLKEINENEDKEKALKEFSKNNVSVDINEDDKDKEDNVDKSVWVLEGGTINIKAKSGSATEVSESTTASTTAGAKETPDGGENPQIDNDEDDIETKKGGKNAALDKYLDKRHKVKKYQELDKKRINKFKKWVKQKQRNKYMQRDDEAKHEMRYIDVVKVSAGKRGSGGK